MLVTLFPMVTLVKLLQPCKRIIPNARNTVWDGHTGQTAAISKAEFPMLVTLSGMLMLVKPVQSRNALIPILVTPLPIITLVKPVQH